MEAPMSKILRDTLKVLDQIEYIIDLKHTSSKKVIDVLFGDLDFQPLDKAEDIYGVSKYLIENGVDFRIIFDLVNNSPDTINNPHGENFVKLGEIVSKDWKLTLKNIKGLKKRLFNIKSRQTTRVPRTVNRHDEIFFDSQQGNLIINSDSVFFAKETRERIMLDTLIERSEEVSWDEIVNIFDGSDEKIPNQKRKHEVADTRDRINYKVTKNTNLREDLVRRRRHNYSLCRKVTRK